jgi:hypothetical protein
LGIFIVLLIPGLLHYLQRRRRVPQRTLSPLIETATLLTVSLGVDLATVGAFAVVRWIIPHSTPNPEQILIRPASYTYHQIGYLTLWLAGLLLFASFLAIMLGRFAGDLTFPSFLTPLVVDVSAWYQVFENGPVGYTVYVACDLEDGSYIAGTLDWYSTQLEETSDRDFALAGPFSFEKDGAESDLEGFDRVILSARQVCRIYVSFVAPEAGRCG